MLDEALVAAHRGRALTPDRPVLRGTAAEPGRVLPGGVKRATRSTTPVRGSLQATMDRFARRPGRAYHLFDYAGHPEAERVVVLMGSGAETANETSIG